MVESLIAIFLLGVCVGVIATVPLFRHAHRTRREVVRVNRETAAQLALREAFVKAVARAEGVEAARGVGRKLRVLP